MATFHAPRPRKVPRGFFIAVHPVAMVLVLAFVYLITMAWLSPFGVSTKMFGQISDLVAFLGTNYNNYMKIVVISTIVAHAIESIIAVVLCSRLNLKKGVTALWFIQTFIFGFFSLNYLLWPQNALLNLHDD